MSGKVARANKGGGKSCRSEIISVRFNPKTHYIAMIAARSHRRTLSSYIECAVEDSFHNVFLSEGKSLSQEVSLLWDVDEADRFVILALNYPHLLDHDEQNLWKMILETGCFGRVSMIEIIIGFGI